MIFRAFEFFKQDLIISETFKNRKIGKEYIIDGFPGPVCDNIRISRSKIFQGEKELVRRLPAA